MSITTLVKGTRGTYAVECLDNEVTKAVNSFSKQLGINRHKLLLEVIVSKSTMTPLGNSGDCLAVNRKQFEIGIALYSDWLLTLAHEMVHVKQFVRRELDLNCMTWKGKRILTEDYMKMPHEREAFKLQRKLVTGYTGE